MDVAGLNIVMEADFNQLLSGVAQANTMLQNFAGNIKNFFNGVPDFAKKFNFTSNGASQAIQDQRELARTARELAAAELDKARAQDILDKAQQRTNNSTRAAKDEYAQLVAANQALVRAYYNEAAAQIRVGDTSDDAKAKLEQMRLEALKGQQQLQQIEQGVGRYQRNVGNYASGNAALAQQLRQITTEIPNFFISARIGMQSLSNNLPGIFNELTRIREANVALAASGQPTVSVFKQFLASFNPLNIAIGVGVGLLTAYGPKLWDLVKGSENSAEAIKKQKQYQQELTNAQEESLKEQEKTIARMNILVALAADESQSTRTRTRAVKELQETWPATFGALSKQVILEGQLGDAVNKTTQAILNRAAAQAAEKKFAAASERVYELTIAQNKAVEEGVKAKREFDLLSQSALANPSNARVQDAAIRAAKRLQDAQSVLAKNIIDVNNAVKEQEGYLNDARNSAAKAGDAFFGKDPKLPKTRNPGIIHDTVTAMDDLIAKNKEVDLQLSDSSITTEEGLKQKIDNYKSYIREITKTSNFKVEIDDARVTDANKNIKDLSSTLEKLKRNNSVDEILQTYNASIASIGDNQLDSVITDVEALNQRLQAANVAKKALLKIDGNNEFGSFISLFTFEIKQLKEELGDAQLQEDGRKLNEIFDSINSQLGAGLIKSSDAATQRVSALRSVLKKLIDENKDGSKNQAIEDLNEQLNSATIEEKVAKLTDSLNSMLKSSLAQTAQILGEGIGKIIAGTGGIGDIFKGIASMLAEQMVTFGKQIIEAAVAFQIAQGALKALVENPALAAVAGAGLIIAGEVIKAQLAEQSKGIGKFANGVIAGRPTLGVFGEYPNAHSNPEIVMPLNKMKDFLSDSNFGSNQQQVFIPEMVLKGEDIYISFKRYEKGFQR